MMSPSGLTHTQTRWNVKVYKCKGFEEHHPLLIVRNLCFEQCMSSGPRCLGTISWWPWGHGAVSTCLMICRKYAILIHEWRMMKDWMKRRNLRNKKRKGSNPHLFAGGRSFMRTHLQQNENNEANNKIVFFNGEFSRHMPRRLLHDQAQLHHIETQQPLALGFWNASNQELVVEVLGLVFPSNKMTAALSILSMLCLFMKHVHPCHWQGTWATCIKCW